MADPVYLFKDFVRSKVASVSQLTRRTKRTSHAAARLRRDARGRSRQFLLVRIQVVGGSKCRVAVVFWLRGAGIEGDRFAARARRVNQQQFTGSPIMAGL